MASSVLCSQGVFLATAMAVSGTVILLAFRLQKSLPVGQIPQPSSASRQALRSCISSGGKRRRKKKRVHFAKDVVDPRGNGEEFRRRHGTSSVANNSFSAPKHNNVVGDGGKVRGMPANRAALYNGILRDRLVHRLAHFY